jgi:molybdopterin-guanine dinucleotide biosynthesis protein A
LIPDIQPDNTLPGLTGIVLTGGKSSRMGAPKALLSLFGDLLINNAIRTLQGVADYIRIIGPKTEYSAFGAVSEDIYKDCGPLGGIHAGLRASRTELNLVIAVDMPFLTQKLLRHLTRRAQSHELMVTVPRIGGYTQPLCALYRRSFAAVAEKSLSEGHYKIDPLFDRASTLYIQEDELRSEGFDVSLFQNINTPEDFSRAGRQKGQGV